MKIYTKKGDAGTTCLVGGTRVGKDDLRVEAYGTADELCAFTAHLYDRMAARPGMELYRSELEIILSELMTLSAALALEDHSHEKAVKCSVKPDSITRLERMIDGLDEDLPPMRFFTLPCGEALISFTHICRTVCRRAERACVRASHIYTVDPQAMAYLNRLSDYFYLLSRRLAMELGVQEKPWVAE